MGLNLSEKCEYDLIIGGGGPAGLSVAINASKYPLDILLLEKKRIGETQKTWSVFPNQLPNYLAHTVCNKISKTIMRTFDGTQIIFEADHTHQLEQIDESLLLKTLESKIKNNCRIKEHCEIISVQRNNGFINITYADGLDFKIKNVKTKLYVDSCGFNSPLIKQLNWQKSTRTWRCLVYEVNGSINPDVAVIGESAFKCSRNPYFWLIPYSSQKFVVGVMYLRNKEISKKTAKIDLEKYINSMQLTGNKTKELFGVVPLGFFQKTYGDNFLLTGDSAKQADSYTGYGLIKSLNCGAIAGEFASKSILANNFTEEFLKKYQEKWRAKYELNSRLQTIIERIISHSSPDDFCNFMRMSKKLPEDIIKRTLRAELKAKDFLTVGRTLGLEYPPWKLLKLVGLKDSILISKQALKIGKLCIQNKKNI